MRNPLTEAWDALSDGDGNPALGGDLEARIRAAMDAIARAEEEAERERDEARRRAEAWRDVARTAALDEWSEVYELPWEEGDE